MDNDLDVALWRAFVYINLWSYKGYARAEKILKKVENKGIKNPIWCYRYAVSIARLRKYEEALKYFLIGTEVDSHILGTGWNLVDCIINLENLTKFINV